MAYNISKGPRDLGDLKNEEDVDTLIDWDQNKITFKTDNVGRLVVDNNHVSGSGALVTVGNAVFGGALNVTGAITTTGLISSSAGLNVVGASSFGSTISAAGSISGSSTLQTVGAAAFGGAINVSGNVFVANTKVIGRDDGTTRKANIQFADVGPSTNPVIVFRNGGSDLMVVDGGGNVGVGNTSPPHKLTIDGVVSGSGLITGASFACDGAISSSATLEAVGNTTVGGNLFVSGSVAMGHGLAGDGALDIKLQNGNPQIIARYSTTHKTSLLTTSNGKFRIAPTGRTLEIDTVDTNGGNIHFTKNAAGTVAGGIAWNTSNEDVTLYSEEDLHLGGGGLSESMFTLDSTGKVGIGIDPTHLLTVAGPISGSSLFHIVGGATFGGAVSTTGSISGSSSLQTVGVTTLGSTLAVSGGVTFAGAVSGSGLFHNVAPATFGSTVATTGSITSNGLTCTGLISGSGALHSVGNVTMGSNLMITGNVGIGDASTLKVCRAIKHQAAERARSRSRNCAGGCDGSSARDGRSESRCSNIMKGTRT